MLSNNDDVFAHPTRILNWLDQPDTQLFMSYIKSKLVAAQYKLERESDPAGLYRHQGAVSAYKEVITIGEAVRQYGKKGA